MGYDLYSQGYVVGTNYLDFSYQSTVNTNSSYDLKNQYSDLAEVAGVLVSAFALPSLLARGVAIKVFGYLGFALSLTNLAIPSYKIDAVETCVKWKAVNPWNTAQTRTLIGSKYVFNHQGRGTQTEYDGEYYPTTSFSSRNEAFALRFGRLIYSSFDLIEVVSWN